MKNRAKKGFTLIELLVVISIIAMLLAILMPSLAKVKEAAKRTICGTRLNQIGLSMMVYAADNNYKYPTMIYYANWPMGVTIENWDKHKRGKGAGSVRTCNPAGLSLLWVNDYIDDMSFLYCPAASKKPFTSDEIANIGMGAVSTFEQFENSVVTQKYEETGDKLRVFWGNVYLGFAYWIGRENSFESLDNAVPKNSQDRSDKVMVTDLCITKGKGELKGNDWASNYHESSSHIFGDKLQGTSVLRNDGSVTWQRMGELEDCDEHRDTDLPENIRFMNPNNTDVNFWFKK